MLSAAALGDGEKSSARKRAAGACYAWESAIAWDSRCQISKQTRWNRAEAGTTPVSKSTV